MANKGGAANLQRFNTERSARLLPLLVAELALCKKRKFEFKTVGLLAAHLADRLGVHRTTLLRGPRYRALLLTHLAVQPGAVDRLSDSTVDTVVLQAKLASARLEASNLRCELKEARARLAVMVNSEAGRLGPHDKDFANLAMLLVSVLSRLDAFIELDRNGRMIVDTAARPSDRVVAGRQRAGPFIAWLEDNQALPGVLQLLNGRLPDSMKKRVEDRDDILVRRKAGRVV